MNGNRTGFLKLLCTLIMIHQRARQQSRHFLATLCRYIHKVIEYIFEFEDGDNSRVVPITGTAWLPTSILTSFSVASIVNRLNPLCNIFRLRYV